MTSDATETPADEASDIAWQLDLVGPADVQAVSAALLSIAVAAEHLVRDVRTAGYGPSSRAVADQAWPENPETTEGTTHIANAQSTSLTSVVASTDHVRAFVQGVRGRRTTVSNWTLARGALEALAPTHYLMGSTSVDDYFRRHIELVLLETKFDKGEYAYRYGAPITVASYRDGFVALASERGIEIPKQGPNLTGLTSSLIEDAAPGSGGRGLYSLFSSVAHGQNPGVQMFIPELGGEIALPRQLVLSATHVQASCLIQVVDDLVEYFEPVAATVERWQAAKQLAVGILFAHSATGDDSARVSV